MNRPRHPSTTASPGTAMSNALVIGVDPAVSNALTGLATLYNSAYASIQSTLATVQNLVAIDRAEMAREDVRDAIEAGNLPTVARFPHSVGLGHTHFAYSINRRKGTRIHLIRDAQAALNDTVTGAWELWGDREGNAYISFENEVDATMFRMALS